VRVWRICRERHAAETLAGRGGLVASGRWHTAGHPIVYTSSSLALAALEVLVHLDKDLLPPGLTQVEIDVPDDVEIRRIDADALPKDWRRYPSPARLQRLGDEWLAAASTVVLRVPSALIPQEVNYLLNPQHPDLSAVMVASVSPFAYDARLVGQE
jgi:RES domain-containing protein